VRRVGAACESVGGSDECGIGSAQHPAPGQRHRRQPWLPLLLRHLDARAVAERKRVEDASSIAVARACAARVLRSIGAVRTEDGVGEPTRFGTGPIQVAGGERQSARAGFGFFLGAGLIGVGVTPHEGSDRHPEKKSAGQVRILPRSGTYRSGSHAGRQIRQAPRKEIGRAGSDSSSERDL
jgi:hypothetical protein